MEEEGKQDNEIPLFHSHRNSSEKGADISRFDCGFMKYFPTKDQILLLISQLVIILFTTSIFYGILGSAVLPGSEIFALFLLYVLSFIGGKIVQCIRLPPLLGMLIAGFLFRNLSFIPFYEDISVRWASSLRGSALVIILLKAGLGLDAEKLKQLKSVVLQLAFIPCIIETIIIGVAAHFLIHLPWIWSILLGFVIAAVSPAVVVPSLLSLQEKEYGTCKGVPTLVIAAASVDDILAITGFSIMLSISLSEGSWIWSLAKGILEPLAGFIFGLACGCCLWYIPGTELSKFSLSSYRVALLCTGGLAVMFLSKTLDVAGAGPFGCLILGFVAAVNWKEDSQTFPIVEGSISVLWQILQPFLFSLIGCEVTIASLQKNIGSSVVVLCIGLLFRIIAAFLATFRGGFNWKEKVFIAFAWLPKATVQAAVGPQALDYVLMNDKGDELEDYAKKVLAVAVLSIIMTAPIGAILISLLGPILLTHDKKNPESQLVQESDETSKELHNPTVCTRFLPGIYCSSQLIIPSKMFSA